MSEKYEVENAAVKSTFLGVERGMFTFSISVGGGSWQQGFGQRLLDKEVDGADYRPSTVAAIPMLREILRVLEVPCWEQLKGTMCRVRRKSYNSPIHSIGHIMENRWVDLEEISQQCSNIASATSVKLTERRKLADMVS